MIRAALAIALCTFALLVGLIVSECWFLAPIAKGIFEIYGEWLGWLSLLLILNLFAAIYTVLRKLALKNTGEKLSHVEKQLRGRTTISEELTERILRRR